mmetsp:Transcript_108842/g.351387  ORF Transcript_108842/g.351387 Transcript_108842/m.351387 type:complete len:239 (-) Transcript_108842:554-1270(-)
MMASIFSLSWGRKHVQPRASKDSKAPWISCMSSSSWPRLRTGTKSISWTSPPTWTYVKISRTHQRRLRYVAPQSITRREQPLRKTGRLRRSVSMLFWSMQHLSNQMRGSRRCRPTKAERKRCSAANLASASSDQECDRNASHAPSLAVSQSAARRGSGWFAAMSTGVSLSRVTYLKRAFALASASSGWQPPTRPARPAAEAWEPRSCRARCSRTCTSCRRGGVRTRRKRQSIPSPCHQ